MLHFISFSSDTCKGGYFSVDLSELSGLCIFFSDTITRKESRSGINSNEFCPMTTLSLLNCAPSCNRFFLQTLMLYASRHMLAIFLFFLVLPCFFFILF